MKKIKQVLFGGVVVVAEFALSVGCCNEFALGVVLIILFYKIKSESGACR